jgi:hypothetical protein
MKFSKLELPNAPGRHSERTPECASGRGDRHGVHGRTPVDRRAVERRVQLEAAIRVVSVQRDRSRHERGDLPRQSRQLETRSPVYTFLPYMINNQPNLIASYLCTPLVKFPIASLKPGEKVRGTTIAELGAGNRPLDMILYKKAGREFLLMSNNSRGVMKIPTENFASATPITAPVSSETAGIAYETISSMKGVEQLDQLDAQNSIVIARSETGLNLQVVPLP